MLLSENGSLKKIPLVIGLFATFGQIDRLSPPHLLSNVLEDLYTASISPLYSSYVLYRSTLPFTSLVKGFS